MLIRCWLPLLRRARRPTLARVAACVSLLVPVGSCAPWIPSGVVGPTDTGGYEVEDLPVVITASYARGDDVYLGLETGDIKRASDHDLSGAWLDLGRPLDGGPRLLFASTAGVLFASADHQPVYRLADEGATWRECLGVPVWRMDEDDEGSLYGGNYTKDAEHPATLYKSCDGGLTWSTVFVDEAAQHIHTVRWDPYDGRLYIAFGDGPAGGYASSADHGAVFEVLGRGPHAVYTDVAFTRDYIFWCTDDGSGQIHRVARTSGAMQVITGWSQFVWFAVSGGEQIYLGTVTSQRFGGERAALLASQDQGHTWQKISQTALSAGPYTQGFFAESRQLSAGGWLYCTGGDEHGPRSYRVRRTPS